LDFVNIHNRVSEKFEGIKRIDIYEYNKNVLREIIINAFAHRDWSLYGAKIRVYIFDDFIEVRSPGRIPDTLTLDRMKMGISYYRNPLIMQMLVDYGYADKIDRGIMSIIKFHQKNNLKLPEFEELGFEFRVRIFRITGQQ
jgi:ATP-dependent DNA helicase RecG